MQDRLQIYDFKSLILLLISVALMPVAGWTDAGKVLSLCLNTDLTPEDRTARLRQEGWRETDASIEAFATALTLTRLTAGKPEEWVSVYDQSRQSAAATTIGMDGFLAAPAGQAAVFITRDRTGLQTCLYLGGALDMEPLEAALDGSILRTIGDVTRIRGDGIKSLISAHGMTEAGRNLFDPRLPYAMTFTVVLDRQAGDIP